MVLKWQMASNFLARLFSALGGFMISILISRYLGAEGKGIASLIITFISICLIISSFVGGGQLVYMLPRHSSRLLFWPSMLFAVITAVLAYVLFLWMPEAIHSYRFMTCIIALLHMITGFQTIFLIAKQKIYLHNRFLILQAVLLVSLVWIGFEWGTANIEDYLFGLLITYGMVTLLSGWWVSQHFDLKPEYNRGALRTLFQLGAVNQTAYVLQFLTFRLSFFLLEYYQDMSSVGIYSNAMSIAESIWLVTRSISVVQYARIANSNDLNASGQLTLRLFSWSGIGIIFAAIILFLLPSDLYVFIFGVGFGEMAAAIRWAVPGIIAIHFMLIIQHFFSGIGQYKKNLYAIAVGFVINGVLCFWWIPPWGIQGAAASGSISAIVSASISIFQFYKIYPFSWKSIVEEWKAMINLLFLKT